MNSRQLHTLINEYWSWLKQETEIRPIDEYVEITTPFLDQHNDHIQIYAKHNGGGWILTDDGYTIRDLQNSGCDIDTERRQNLLRTVARRLGVELKEEELLVHTSQQDFARKKHNLIQAIIGVGDLFHTSSSTVISIFLEEVENWLRTLDVRFTESVKFTGRSGYDHHFDFVIPSSHEAPERVVKVINRPDRASIERMIMAWSDTKDVRPEKSQALAILNDVVKEPNFSAIEALENYDVKAIPWSRRTDYTLDLAA